MQAIKYQKIGSLHKPARRAVEPILTLPEHRIGMEWFAYPKGLALCYSETMHFFRVARGYDYRINFYLEKPHDCALKVKLAWAHNMLWITSRPDMIENPSACPGPDWEAGWGTYLDSMLPRIRKIMQGQPQAIFWVDMHLANGPNPVGDHLYAVPTENN